MILGIFGGVVIVGIVLLAIFRARSNKNDQRRREADSKH